MNGIIHNCTHGNADEVGFMDEENMMVKILGYIDSLMRIIKPQQMLYMAIDGTHCPSSRPASFPILVPLRALPLRPSQRRRANPKTLYLVRAEAGLAAVRTLQGWRRAPR